MKVEVYSSTLVKNHEAVFPRFMDGTKSISPIETLFNSEEVKKAVDSLVLSKFDFKTNRFKYNRRQFRRYGNSSSDDTTPSTSWSYDANQQHFASVFSARSDDFSINTCNVSLLVSKDSITNENSNTRSSMDSTFSENSNSASSASVLSFHTTNKYSKLEALYEELSLTVQKKEQILKAIYYDFVSNKNRITMPRMEAEKLLLLTDLKSELLLKNIEESSFEEEEVFSFSVTVTRLNLWTQKSRNSDQYFLCVLTHGSQIYASQITKPKSNGIIYFKRKFSITDLPANFKIKLSIYVIDNDMKVARKSIQRLICDQRDQLDIGNEDIPLQDSLFTLWAEKELTSAHVKKLLNLESVTLGNGWFTADVDTDVNVNLVLSGFLNISKSNKSYPIWDRQWCVLNGKILKYYNYPTDEVPAGFVNLENYTEMRHLSKAECPRSNTLMLRFNNHETLLLSADRVHECQYWEQYLKNIVSALSICRINSLK